MLVFCTDFGCCSPYQAQMQGVAARLAPNVPTVSLFSDLPPFRPDLAAYLLPRYVDDFPPGSVFVCVVDPGVGSARAGLAVRWRDRWFVGPDNGLLSQVSRHDDARVFDICWQPGKMSHSFHGRDWFTPLACQLLLQDLSGVRARVEPVVGSDWPGQSWRVIYVDRFGNCMLGVDASAVVPVARLWVGEHVLSRARVLSEVPVGRAFWYENANGLLELSVNQGRADVLLGLQPGSRIEPPSA